MGKTDGRCEMSNVLKLVLKHKWYDMISQGEKKEEYREIKPYWLTRIGCQALGHCTPQTRCQVAEVIDICDDKFTQVQFFRGYTSTTMLYEIDSISIGEGDPAYGAPKGKDVYIIKLGNRISN